MLDEGDDEESKLRHNRFSVHYDFQSHVSRANKPLREWNEILFRTYVSDNM